MGAVPTSGISELKSQCFSQHAYSKGTISVKLQTVADLSEPVSLRTWGGGIPTEGMSAFGGVGT